MAIFQYGAIITRISGSIGGTNFRLFRNTNVISNKSNGYSRNTLFSNPRLSQLRWLFSQWRFLSAVDKSSWTTLTATLQFPNRFGILRHLSARQLYTKMNSQLLPVNKYYANANTKPHTISKAKINDSGSSFAAQTIYVEIFDVDVRNFFLLQFELVTDMDNKPTFTRRRFMQVLEALNDFQLQMWDPITKNFPNIAAGSLLRVYITPMSESGLRGVPLVLEMDIQP